MDLSSVISDVVQSVATKGATEIAVSICDDGVLHTEIECADFIFPHIPNAMRSLGYEYIFKGEYRIDRNRLQFTTDLPLGMIEKFCVNILSSNVGLKEFKFTYRLKDREYVFSRNDTLEQLGDVFVGEYNVLLWIEDHIKSGIETIKN